MARTYDLKASQDSLNDQAREAVKAKDQKGVMQLLDAKANVNFVDSTGSTLAHLAALFNERALLELLIARGANLNMTNRRGESVYKMAELSLQHYLMQRYPPTE
jgi:ankyrin repeat protein